MALVAKSKEIYNTSNLDIAWDLVKSYLFNWVPVFATEKKKHSDIYLFIYWFIIINNVL